MTKLIPQYADGMGGKKLSVISRRASAVLAFLERGQILDEINELALGHRGVQIGCHQRLRKWFTTGEF